MPPHAAASSLADILADYPWYRGVGVGTVDSVVDGPPCLYLYTRSLAAARRTLARLAGSEPSLGGKRPAWEGYPVIVRKMDVKVG